MSGRIFDKKTKRLIIIGFCFVLTVLIASSYISIGYITSGSMDPTLMTGDIELSRKFNANKDYKRGTIVTLKKGAVEECPNEILGKRIIGIAGDEITFKNGYVYINGERYVEDYIPEYFETNSQKTFYVPDNCVFLLGDNREASFDARFWENPYISTDDIKCTHICVIIQGKKHEESTINSEISCDSEINEVETKKSIYTPRRAPLSNPLSEGEIGVCFTSVDRDQQFLTNSFRIDRIYKDKEAELLLKNLLKDEYKSPIEGTVWNVLEYSTEKTPLSDEGYINIKLRDCDGNQLVFEGVNYTKRTYDYFLDIKHENVYSKCYCYYQVPVGCNEYLLEFGMHDNKIEGLINIEGTYLLVNSY